MAESVVAARPHRVPPRRPLALVLVTTAVVLTLVGCGRSSAANAVPALEDRLAVIDTAIVREDFDAAREALDRLVRTTTQARQAGELDQEQADAILAAAAALEARLPAPEEPPTDAETPPPQPSSPPEDDEDNAGGDDGDGDDDGEGGDDDSDDESNGKDGSGKDGSGQGGGNGPSSGNGPDDGHGN
jgi:uncharacterized membrane protein YgcG